MAAGKIADLLSPAGKTVTGIALATENVAKSIKANGTAVWKYIWQNPNGLTPQQAADSLGDSAVDGFTQYSAFKTLLANMQLQDYSLPEIPAGWSVNPDPDRPGYMLLVQA